jgi:hypothetical protein
VVGRETLALMDDVPCDHQDCDRTARPLFFTLYSRHGELLDERTYYFCPEHRDALFALEATSSLPPAEWLPEDLPVRSGHLGAAPRGP